MDNCTRPPGPPQGWLEFQRFYNSPHARELREQIQRFADSPLARETREAMLRMRDSPLGRELRKRSQIAGEQAKGDEKPPPKLKRKRGGGRKRILTDAEIKQLQLEYHSIRRDKPNLSQERVFEKLRKLLRPDKHDISDTTLRDHIVPSTPRK